MPAKQRPATSVAGLGYGTVANITWWPGLRGRAARRRQRRRARRDGQGVAGEDIAVVDVLAVIGGGVVLVLIDVVAGQIEAGEEAFAARVGEELGIGEGGDRG